MTERDRYLGVDVGGTFTDVVLAERDGRAQVWKVRTTAPDPVDGVLRGIRAALDETGVEPRRIGRVVHATTIATNLILERRGARVAFAVTRGFADLVRVPRGGGATAERAATLVSYVQPEALVPPALTVEVPERLGPGGRVVAPLDRDAARRVARALLRRRPDAVAVCLLHAYADGVHERLLAEACAELDPDVPVYLSSEVAPSIREYGRAVTTIFSAYVGPATGGYLDRLAGELRGLGIDCPAHVMESGGGVMPLAGAAARAIRTVESGPAAGVVSTRSLAGPEHGADLLSFDMGGTTAKCGVVGGGRAERRYEFHVGGPASMPGRRAGGYPIRVPVVDLAEVGAGGGSVAWVDAAGGLRVGPRSAGANPGPACYGLGGTEPTVTDANLVLGHLSPDGLAGGAVRPSRALAEDALERAVARPLGLPVVEAAAAVHDIVTAEMANAVRMVTIERGLDPRDFTLVAFGGSGPVHAARIARAFGIRRVVVPAHAGVRSAVGLLGADLATDRMAGCAMPLAGGDPDRLRRAFAELERQALDDLSAGPGLDGLHATRSADVRFAGQAHQLVVPVPDGPLDAAALEQVSAAFHDLYKRTYGIEMTGAAELVGCRLRLEKRVPRWDPGERPEEGPAEGPEGDPAEGAGRAAAPSGRRALHLTETGERVEVPVHRWADLEAGHTLAGPAVVDGADATLVLPPGCTGRVDRGGAVVLTLTGG